LRGALALTDRLPLLKELLARGAAGAVSRI
jgi:hypothetical protein